MDLNRLRKESAMQKQANVIGADTRIATGVIEGRNESIHDAWQINPFARDDRRHPRPWP